MADPSVEAIVAAVTRIENAGDALIASYRLYAQQVRDAAGDRAATLAVAARMEEQSAEMETAVFENTPTPDPLP
jgi:hypothetical protein